MGRRSKTLEAAKYIEENFQNKNTNELIKETSEKFNLKESSVRGIFIRVAYLNMIALVEENRLKRELEKAEKIKNEFFKGRKRLIDDSKLFGLG